MSDQQNTTPPAWYPDPDPANPGGERWWDGTRWTEHSRPAPTPAPEYHLPAQPVAAPSYGQYRSTAPVSQPYPIAPGFPPVRPGTSALTWQFWLILGLPLLTLVAFMFVDFSGYFRAIQSLSLSTENGAVNSTEFASAISAFVTQILVVDLIALVVYGVTIVFAYLDHRELNRRGFVRPFHWAWAFFGLAFGIGALVYPIGRIVVTIRRRGAHAYWPLWALIAVFLVLLIVPLVRTLGAVTAIVSGYPTIGS